MMRCLALLAVVALCVSVRADVTPDGVNGCGTVCGLCPTGPACLSGLPKLPCCWTSTGPKNKDGFCTDSRTDVNNCGTCGFKCNANAVCAGGQCVCTPGFLDCDKSWSNGCEINKLTDQNNCGSCGNKCGANAVCSNGACICLPSNFKNCDGSWSNGCEVNTLTDTKNCGACGNSCGANSVCTNGQCGCLPGYRNCDGKWSNGCEVDIRSDANNCNGCSNATTSYACGNNALCSPSGPDSGQCQCVAANYKNCDGNFPLNGCEVDTNTDTSNCGACGKSCGANSVCTNGLCGCQAGYLNCDSAIGCEVNKLTDNNNCGACGQVCPSNRTCANGQCVCTGGLTDCSGTCVNTQSDNNNCGTCGTVCPSGFSCFSGACAESPVPCGTTNSYNGGQSNTARTYSVAIGTGGIKFKFTYDARNIPDQFTIKTPAGAVLFGPLIAGNKDAVSYCPDPSFIPTKVGAGSAFIDRPTGISTVVVEVYSPCSDTYWEFNVGCATNSP